jgi:hypothetical protein
MNDGICGWLVCDQCGSCWCNLPDRRKADKPQWPAPPRYRPYTNICHCCARRLEEGEGKNKRCYELRGGRHQHEE